MDGDSSRFTRMFAHWRALLVALAIGVAGAGFAGCDESDDAQDSVDEAQEQIDEAEQNANEAIEDAEQQVDEAQQEAQELTETDDANGSGYSP